MAIPKSDLLTHPHRARILAALMGRELSTAEIAERVPEVPLPSLYRHVKLLVEGGVLEVASESAGRGGEKRYTVNETAAQIRPEDVKGADSAELMRYLTTFTGVLNATYLSYLDSLEDSAERDRMACLMGPVYLNPSEWSEVLEGIQKLLEPYREPKPDARRYLAAQAFLPEANPVFVRPKEEITS